MAAECLEYRVLPTGVTITSMAGVVNLSANSGDNTIAASVVNGNLEFTGSNGTTFTFNGTTAATVDVPLGAQLKAVNFNLTGGNESVTFDAQGLPATGNINVVLGKRRVRA